MTTQPYISTMTYPPMPGFRVWFNNCGLEPHFYPEVDEDMMDSFNEVRPWTAEDDLELREWLKFRSQSAQIAEWLIYEDYEERILP